MGRTAAEGITEALEEGLLSRRQALEWHLQSNHYPSLPLVLIPIAEAAIDLAYDEAWDTEIPLPDGHGFRRTSITCAEAIELMHLESFVENVEVG